MEIWLVVSFKGRLSQWFLWYKYKEILDRIILAQIRHLNRNVKAFIMQREMSAQEDILRLIKMALHAWLWYQKRPACLYDTAAYI